MYPSVIFDNFTFCCIMELKWIQTVDFSKHVHIVITYSRVNYTNKQWSWTAMKSRIKYFMVNFITVFTIGYLGPDWCTCSDCDRKNLQMRVVAILSSFKRFVRLILQLEISVFTQYLWLINYQIHQQLNNKLIIFIFYIIIKILNIIIL